MKRLSQLVAIILLAFLMAGSQCQGPTVIVPEGPVAAQLGAEKDKQIAGLVARVKAEQEARELEQAQAALVAANLEGILFAAEHVPTGLPRNAIEEEARLGKERSPPADPTELLKAKDRVIAILNGEVEKAKALYSAASTEAAQAKALLAAKDQEIAKRDNELNIRATEIARLEGEKKAEQEKHVNDIKDLIAKKDAEIQRIKDENAAKERRWWIMATRIAGLGLIVVGVVLLAVFKLAAEGGGLAAGGLLIGLLSMFVEWLTAQWWFFPLCGLLTLGVLITGGFAVRRMWKKHRLGEKKTQAIQDYIDEKTIKGDSNAAEDLKEHLTYRIGGKDSFWGKEQAKEVAALGLVDPKGEEALKSSP